jgi:hypothetical protein
MEPVSNIASLITLVGAVLKCTKSFYQTISGFNNAYQWMESLLSAVKDLGLILTALENSLALVEPSTNLQNIEARVQACGQSVRRYETILKKHQMGPSDSKVKQTWRRVKAQLAERTLQHISTEMNQHCTALGALASILGL